jgi:hypothetical protein
MFRIVSKSLGGNEPNSLVKRTERRGTEKTSADFLGFLCLMISAAVIISLTLKINFGKGS